VDFTLDALCLTHPGDILTSAVIAWTPNPPNSVALNNAEAAAQYHVAS
jgi:hypothetical protein